ncbi:MAG TPA: type IV pilus assembly protein PilM [Candidatus Hydrogenedentes bacterium]|nr:type IV pilus assembly protein PilM [Candidatus Hydrogenedentota bacterium]
MGFRRPKKAIGIDVGSHSAKAVLMSRFGGRLRVEAAVQVLVDRNLLNSDPNEAQAQAVRETLREMPVSQCLVVSAMAGQTVVVRYPRLTVKSRESLEDAIRAEASHSIPYDLNDVFLDWHILEEAAEGDQRQVKVLLVAAKHEVIDSRMQVLSASELQPGMLGVDSLALADAAEACDFLRVGETVALINVGLTSSCVHFVKDGASSFIREVNWGLREAVQAVAKDRRFTYEDALREMEEYKYTPEEVPEATVAEMLEAEEDDIPMAKEATKQFPKLAPIGDPSLLEPLADELEDLPGAGRQGLSDDGYMPAGGGMAVRPLTEVLAAPFTRLSAEFRRSFDFYEHQLYERPVDRIIVCGGGAMMAFLRDTLQYELQVDSVEVAHPDDSSLLLGSRSAVEDLLERPPQFMVAIGLAARGMADL